MERSTFFFDQEVKFKKADLEVLEDDEYSNSPWYTICNLSGVEYYISIYPNEKHRKNHPKSWLYIFVDLGRATSVDVNAKVTIENSSFSANIESSYKECDGAGERICTTSQLFDPANNCFTDGEMIVKIKGSFKIELNRIKYPFSVQWKVKECDVKALKTLKKFSLETQYFKVSPDSDIEYCISFSPDEDRDEYQGTSDIQCRLNFGLNSKVEGVCKLSIDSANFIDESGHIFKSFFFGWIFYFPFCLTKDLFNPEKRYFVNGELTVNVTGTLMVEKEKEPTILALENGIVQKGYHRGKNFTIMVGLKSIKVHKHVLQSASPVFAGMFDSNLKEVKEKKMDIIDFEYEIVHAAMKLLYSSSLPQTFTFEQMLKLLQFSDKYEINLIKDPVQDYLIKRISPTNVCHLINATTTFINAPKLLTKCKEYLVERVKQRYFVPDLDTIDNNVMREVFLLVVTQIV